MAGVATVGAIFLGGLYYGAKQLVNYLYQTAENIKSKTQTKSKTSTKTKNEDRSNTKIYRWGGTNPSNLTPKKKDVDNPNYGLSFSYTPQVNAAETTIEAINNTGILYAIQDKPNHISVYPIGGTMEDWAKQGPGSIWTGALKSIVVKWDGIVK